MEELKSIAPLVVKKGKLKNIIKPWHKYLEDKIMLLISMFGIWNLIVIEGEEDLNGLCEYAWNNDPEAKAEYDTLKGWQEEVENGNDGFGFDYDEIEIINSGEKNG